jgi:uncharacterized membrane protein YjdF
MTPAFPATQGDVWDTRWVMSLACVGGCLAQLLLSNVPDKQLRRP